MYRGHRAPIGRRRGYPGSLRDKRWYDMRSRFSMSISSSFRVKRPGPPRNRTHYRISFKSDFPRVFSSSSRGDDPPDGTCAEGLGSA